MIGLIITGHGHFASGIASALKLLIGQQDFLAAVDFEQDQTDRQLSQNLKAAIESMHSCDKIFLLCDIVGGSPYKIAVSLSIDQPKLTVLYGINLAMALELSIHCRMEPADNAAMLADDMIKTGKLQIGKYSL